MLMKCDVMEQGRLTALDRLDIIEVPSDGTLDRITRIVCRALNVPMSTVSFVDGHRQWFASRQGVEASETAKGPAFCRIVVESGKPLVVADAWADERFRENPLVVGPPFVRFYAGYPLRTADGHNVGTLCAFDTEPRTMDAEQLEILEDLTALVMKGLEFRQQATTDNLTGSLSRRAFREQADAALSLAIRYNHNLSCITFDLDHFKAINDRFGHACGDQVLRQVIATCRRNLRKPDIIGRLGGEEFAVALPHTPPARALKVAEKLRAAIARAPIRVGNNDVDVTSSFGIASMDGTVAEFDTLLARADAALYEAKTDGRNRCVVWRALEAAADQGPRPRVLKAGRISFAGGHASVDCTVRSISEKGAALAVINSSGIPEKFKLMIPAEDFSRLAHITGKSERQIEVAFE